MYMCWCLGYTKSREMLNYFNIFQVGFAGLRQQPNLSTLFILEQMILSCSIIISSTIDWILMPWNVYRESIFRPRTVDCSYSSSTTFYFMMVAPLPLQIMWTQVIGTCLLMYYASSWHNNFTCLISFMYFITKQRAIQLYHPSGVLKSFYFY